MNGSPFAFAASTPLMWTVAEPSVWPPAPSPMSFTLLRDIETCPLRWSLRRATYVGLWSGAGYPSAPRLATLGGQVVHGALERIIDEVGRQAARGSSSADVFSGNDITLGVLVGTLRALGGITIVLESVVADIVAAWAANPRIGSRARDWETELQRSLPALRQRVQQLLAHVEISRVPIASEVRASTAVKRNSAQLGVGQTSISRALGDGVYAEVPLNSAALDWFGKADLLRIADICEIIDFKTGAAKDDHRFQLWAYALLWRRDAQKNPTGRLASRLTLVYSAGSIDVRAPSAEELDAFEAEIVLRSNAARRDVATQPPDARPSHAACKWCDVRQLCDRYWEPATRIIAGNERESEDGDTASGSSFIAGRADVEVQVTAAQGEWSWHATIVGVGALTVGIESGGRVLIRARSRDDFFPTIIRSGVRARVVGAQFVEPSEESAGLPVVSLGRSTEVFVLPRNLPETATDYVSKSS